MINDQTLFQINLKGHTTSAYYNSRGLFHVDLKFICNLSNLLYYSPCYPLYAGNHAEIFGLIF
jgi:hypothetical protein